MKNADPRKLRAEAAQAQSKGNYRKALASYEKLCEAEPSDPLGPHRAGELYARLDRPLDAIRRLRQAAKLYAARGFLVKSIAVCKMILQIDPEHTETQAELSALYAQKRQRDDDEPGRQSTPATPLPPQAPAGRHAPVEVSASPETHLPGVVVGEDDSAEIALELDTSDRSSGIFEPLQPVGASPLAADENDWSDVDRQSEPAVAHQAGKASASRKRSAGEIRGGVPRVPPALDSSASTARPQPPLRDGAPLAEIHLAQALPESRSASQVLPGSPDAFEIALEDHPSDEVFAPAPGSAQSGAGTGPVAPIARELPRTPLFSALDEDSLRELIENLDYESFEVGDVIARQGDIGDSLYVIASGGVAVLHEGPPEREVARLGEGEFFGEIAVITDFPRMATVVATHHTEVLRVSRQTIAKLVAAHPQVLSAVLTFVRDRLMATLQKTSPLFLSLPESERQVAASHFKLLEVEAGSTLVHQGSLSEALYVVLAGRVQVSSEREGLNYELGELPPGAVIGERSLLMREEAGASVRTRTRSWLLAMGRPEFQALVTAYPMVLEYVHELAEQRTEAVERLELV